MRSKTATLVDIGLAHLGRFAFFTRDNPFLSSTAAIDLRADQRRALGELLEGTRSADDWLSSRQGRRLREGIRIGCVPRDVQLVSPAGKPAVGVESVHAFLHAPLFWLLVAILWTITVGRRLDGALGEEVTGYRLAKGFVERPARHGVMFRSDDASYNRWKRFAAEQARDHHGDTLAATTIDIRDFYYSVSVAPSRIVDAFTSALDGDVRMPAHASALTELLDALHAEFARRFKTAKPRGPVGADVVPLPVGPPSSQVLANLIMSLVAEDLRRKPAVIAAATYADDIVLVSRMLPEVRETTPDYLGRLEILAKNGTTLVAPSVAELASLEVGLEKSSTVFVRGEAADSDEEPAGDESETLDPYIAGDPSPEWGGGLRTVLRATYRRERVPRRLVRDIHRLVDEIRVGLDRAEAQVRVRAIIDNLDSALFLAVRPYWTDLLVAAIAASGASAVPALTYQFDELVRSLKPPAGASSLTVRALRFGLRASWIHALAQAVSVSLGRTERDGMMANVPQLISGGPLGDLTTKAIADYAQRLRERRLVDPAFVAAPLAEFTDWPGPLIGESAYVTFLAWTLTQGAKDTQKSLQTHLAKAVRFIPLHEACLAVHTWARPDEEAWLKSTFIFCRGNH